MLVSLNGRLHQYGNMCKAGIMKQSPQTIFANHAFAQPRMHIAMTPQRLFGIVEMNNLESLWFDNIHKLLQYVPRRLSTANIIAISPEVRGIQANSDPLLVVFGQQSKNSRQLREISTQRVARSHVVFQQQHDFSWHLRQNPCHPLRHSRYSSLYPCTTMTARMKHYISDPQPSGTLQCPGQQNNRFLPDRLIQRAQVDQIRRMNNNRVQTTTLSCLSKKCIPLHIVGGWTPSGGIAGKHLHGVTADPLGDLRRLDRSRTGGHMASDAHYLSPSLSCSCSLSCSSSLWLS